MFLLVATGKCSSHFSSEKPLFATDVDDYRNTQLIKMQRITDRACPDPVIYPKYKPYTKAQRALWEKGEKKL